MYVEELSSNLLDQAYNMDIIRSDTHLVARYCDPFTIPIQVELNSKQRTLHHGENWKSLKYRDFS